MKRYSKADPSVVRDLIGQLQRSKGAAEERWQPMLELSNHLEENGQGSLAHALRTAVWKPGAKFFDMASGHAIHVEPSRTGKQHSGNSGWSYWIDHHPQRGTLLWVAHPYGEPGDHRAWHIPFGNLGVNRKEFQKRLEEEGVHPLEHMTSEQLLRNVDEFTRAYIQAALWSSTDEMGDPLDQEFYPADIHPKTIRDMKEEAKDFQDSYAHLMPAGNEAHSGHNFWLSRNGHGAGFFDNAHIYGHVGARELQDLARIHGEKNLEVGDDGMIHYTDESSRPVLRYPEPNINDEPHRHERQKAPAGGIIVREGTRSPVPGKTYGGGIFMPGGRFIPQVGVPAKKKKALVQRHDSLFGPRQMQRPRRYAAPDRSVIDGLLKEIAANPGDDRLQQQLADHLEEHGLEKEAEAIRQNLQGRRWPLMGYTHDYGQNLYLRHPSGTAYHLGTNPYVIAALEAAMSNGGLTRIHYGHTSGEQTGKDWLEEHGTSGRISRSSGSFRVPLVVPPRSNYGDPVLTDSIVKIRDANGRTLYQHPNYHHGKIQLGASGHSDVPFGVFVDGSNHANFRSELARRRFVNRMGLTVDPEPIQPKKTPKQMQRRYAAFSPQESMEFVKRGKTEDPVKVLRDWSNHVEEHGKQTVADLLRRFADRVDQLHEGQQPVHREIFDKSIFSGRMTKSPREPEGFGFHHYGLSGENYISLSHPEHPDFKHQEDRRLIFPIPVSDEELPHLVEKLHAEGIPQWTYDGIGRWHPPRQMSRRRYAADPSDSHAYVNALLATNSWNPFNAWINKLRQTGRHAVADVLTAHQNNHLAKRLPMDFGGPIGYPSHWGEMGHPNGFSFQFNANEDIGHPFYGEGHIKLRHIVPGTDNHARYWVMHGNLEQMHNMRRRLADEGVPEYDKHGWVAHEAPATGGSVEHIGEQEATRQLRPRRAKRRYAAVDPNLIHDFISKHRNSPEQLINHLDENGMGNHAEFIHSAFKNGHNFITFNSQSMNYEPGWTVFAHPSGKHPDKHTINLVWRHPNSDFIYSISKVIHGKDQLLDQLRRLIDEGANPDDVTNFYYANDLRRMSRFTTAKRRYAAVNPNVSHHLLEQAINEKPNEWDSFSQWANHLDEHGQPTVAELMRMHAQQYQNPDIAKRASNSGHDTFGIMQTLPRENRSPKPFHGFAFQPGLSGSHGLYLVHHRGIAHESNSGYFPIKWWVRVDSPKELRTIRENLLGEGVPELDNTSPGWFTGFSEKPWLPRERYQRRRYAAVDPSTIYNLIRNQHDPKSIPELTNHLEESGLSSHAEFIRAARSRPHSAAFRLYDRQIGPYAPGWTVLAYPAPIQTNKNRHLISLIWRHPETNTTATIGFGVPSSRIIDLIRRLHDEGAHLDHITEHNYADDLKRMQRQYAAKSGLRMLPFQGSLLEKANTQPGLEEKPSAARVPTPKKPFAPGPFPGTRFSRGPADGIIHKMTSSGSPQAVAERVTLNKVLAGMKVPVNHPQFGREAATRWIEAASHVMSLSPNDPAVTYYKAAAANPGSTAGIGQHERSPLETAAYNLFDKTLRVHPWLQIYNGMASRERQKTEAAARPVRGREPIMLEPDEYYSPSIKPAGDLPVIKPALAPGELGRKPGTRSRRSLIDEQMDAGASKEQVVEDLMRKFLLTKKQATDAYRRAAARRAAKKLSRLLNYRRQPSPESVHYYRPGGRILQLCGSGDL